MQVDIRKDDLTGIVIYDEPTKTVTVAFPDKEILQEVRDYLTSVQEYRIPDSNEIDDYHIEMCLPTESLFHMELALSSLYGHTDCRIMVDWSTQKD